MLRRLVKSVQVMVVMGGALYMLGCCCCPGVPDTSVGLLKATRPESAPTFTASAAPAQAH